MMCRLFFNLTCNCFQSKLFLVRAGDPRTCRAWAGLPQQMWISKNEYELFESVEPALSGVQECAEVAERQDAKWREECLCLTIHNATALHLLFSVFSVVVDSVCTDVTPHAR